MIEDANHIKKREEVRKLINEGFSIENIAKKLSIPLGTRYIQGSAKWYVFCIKVKENQKKAIQKHPNLYSKAGKIAQQRHPWIGKNLGSKYGPIQGKINAEKLKGNSKYFSMMAKKLQENNPNHSKNNMIKAHVTMKKLGIFNEHQRKAALKCKEKNPSQLKEMSKKAHEKYPLALLALESKRRNYPYELMGCLFDSNEERIICKKLVEAGLIEKPIEKVNIHFRIRKSHIDFFIENQVFVEYHPPRKFGRKIETSESYKNERRKLLDEHGFKDNPLIVINNLKEADEKIKQIKSIIHSL
jgi:hypothetical protein